MVWVSSASARLIEATLSTHTRPVLTFLPPAHVPWAHEDVNVTKCERK